MELNNKKEEIKRLVDKNALLESDKCKVEIEMNAKIKAYNTLESEYEKLNNKFHKLTENYEKEIENKD